MIVLHAGLDEGQLLLWGETSPGTPSQPDWLTYDPGAKRLAAVTASAVPGLALQPERSVLMYAWLPTLGRTPVASSPLVAETPETKDQPVLKPWKVDAFRLSGAQAVELLCACVGRDILAPGVIAGPTLAFWSTVLRFAAALTA